MIKVATSLILLSLTPKLLEKNSGMVNAPCSSDFTLRSFAITNHAKAIPRIQPMAVHISINPAINTAPGRPRRSHADSPDALSEKATTQGFSLLPAIIKSSCVFVSLYVHRPTPRIIRR